ncbi:MAG: ribonuclease HI [Oscillospiraceae bacterium]|nr:ribonuclease HI [Oscillospiraceae bacterium]
MNKVNLYADGACSGNPGPGGWGTILECRGYEKELSGGEPQTTNNRMELTGIIEGLKNLNQACHVTVYSDSKYITDSINKGWVYSWQRNGWRKSDKSPALNVDLWQELLDLIGRHKVTFVWIKGHAGHRYNERCDEMAVEQSKIKGRRL